MKFRPLCTSYLSDALVQLEEIGVREERPVLVIEPVIGNNDDDEESSSESECEEATQKAPPRPPPARTHKRPLLTLEDDASFEYIKQDSPVKENDNDNKSRMEEQAFLQDDDDDDDDMSLEPSKESIRDSTAYCDPPQKETDDDIFSMDTSSDEEIVAKPFQLVTTVTRMKKRPTASILKSASRHPLVDTDDELDFIDTSNKERPTKKRLPSVVDTSLVHSPATSVLDSSQSQDADMDDGTNGDNQNEQTMVVNKDNILVSSPTTDNVDMRERDDSTEQMSVLDKDQYMGVEDTVELSLDSGSSAKASKKVSKEYLPIDPSVFAMIMQSLQCSHSRKRIASFPHNLSSASTNDARAAFWASSPVGGLGASRPSSFGFPYGNTAEMQRLLRLADIHGTIRRQESLEERDDVHDMDVHEAESKEPREACKDSCIEDAEQPPTPTPTAAKGPCLKDEATVSIEQETQKHASTSNASQDGTGAHQAESKEPQDACNDSSADNTEQSSVPTPTVARPPVVLQKEPKVPSKQTTGVHESESKATQDCTHVLGRLDDKPKLSTEMPSASGVSTPSESGAFAAAKPSFTIPPVWLDVCKAIMENPEAFALLSSTTHSQKKPAARTTAASRGVASKVGGGGVVHTSVQDESPALKRDATKEPQQTRVVSHVKSKEPAIAEGENCQPENGQKPHRHRTEQEKLDRQERKRHKKEKRERKKRKKAERKEKKRKAREQQNKSTDAIVESRASLFDKNRAPHRPAATDGLFCEDQVYDMVTGGAKRQEKRRKVEAEEKPARVGDAVAIEGTKVTREQQQLPVTQGAQDPNLGEYSNTPGKRTASNARRMLDSKRPARDVFADEEVAPAMETEKKRRKKSKRHTSDESVKEAIPSGKGAPPEAMTNRAHLVTEGRAKKSVGTGKLAESGRKHYESYNSHATSGTDTRSLHHPEDDRSTLQNAATAPDSGNVSSNVRRNEPEYRALCSESFFEEWTDAVALLASGQWYSLCAQPQEHDDGTPPRLGPKIQLFDTPLLEGEVDIELPGRAIIIHRLSSWEQAPETVNACAKHLVRLTALEVYKDIDVIVCADTDITPALAMNLAFIQNAVVRQSGLNCSCSPSFQVTAPDILSPVVASRVLSTNTQGIPTDSFMTSSISDVRVQERARFLRTLAPSLSVCGSLQCLMCLSQANEQNEHDPTSRAFQQLFSSNIDRRLFGNEKVFEANAPALRQLSMAINVPFAP